MKDGPVQPTSWWEDIAILFCTVDSSHTSYLMQFTVTCPFVGFRGHPSQALSPALF